MLLSKLAGQRRYKFNPSPTELLSGEIHAAIIIRNRLFIAWTRAWEGPARPDYMGARADLLDRLHRHDLPSEYF